jgi:23S rRNA (adenine-N6)-dimethyltransferase
MPYHQKDSLSQNFIKYPDLVADLLDASDLKRSDTVLEIGPGRGIITNQLLKRVSHVIVVEKDPILAAKLIELNNNSPKLKILPKDFLNCTLPVSPYKVFSNIPFSLTSKIITKFLQSPLQPESMYLIMQLEALEKFMGVPSDTQSSLLAKPWYEINNLGDIDRSSFTKKPQVKIVLAEFKKRPTPFIRDEFKSEYRDFILYGFNQWQPTFLDSYQKVFTYSQLKTLEKTFKITGLKPTEVSFDTWLQIFKTYLKIATPAQKEIIDTFRPQKSV